MFVFVRLFVVIPAACLVASLATAASAQSAPVAAQRAGPVDPYGKAVARLIRSIAEFSRWPEETRALRLCVATPTDHAGEVTDFSLARGRRVTVIRDSFEIVPKRKLRHGLSRPLFAGSAAPDGRGAARQAGSDHSRERPCLPQPVHVLSAVCRKFADLSAKSRCGFAIRHKDRSPRSQAGKPRGSDPVMKARVASAPSIEKVIARGYLRLVLLAVALCAVALILIGSFLIRGYADQTLSLAARTVSYSVEPALVFDDKAGVEEALHSIGAMEAVRKIEVYSQDGRIMGDWQSGDIGSSGGVSAAVDRLFWPNALTYPVRHEGKTLGELRLYGSSGALLDYLLLGAVIGLACLGATIIAMNAMARNLRKEIVRPLDELAAVAKAVGRDRDFQRRVAPVGIVEFDNFSYDFNRLLSEMEGWHTNLTTTNQELAHRVEHDPLTGLGNRDRFRRAVESLLKVTHETQRQFSILFIDLDRFKAVNDTHGHQAGDAVLVEVARRLSSCVRDSDLVCRMGGDEFAIVLDIATAGSSVRQMIRRIEAIMAAPLRWQGATIIHIEMSIGEATFPEHGKTVDELMHVADRKMYSRKRGELENEGVEESDW